MKQFLEKLKKKEDLSFEESKSAFNILMNGEANESEIFDLLGIGKEEADEKFGFLLDAFKYGAPPHGGIAFGFDRIVMLLANCNQIRDVIAFPKTTSAMSLMDRSPSDVDEEQLIELGLKIINEDKK